MKKLPFVLVLLLAGCATTPQLDLRTQTNVEWAQAKVEGDSGKTIPLLYDLYLPENMDPAPPVFLFVHGGRFSGGSHSDKEIIRLASQLSQQGFACMSISYRLKEHNPPAPGIFASPPLIAAAHAAVVDTKAAYRYLRSHAEVLGVDKDRIILIGDSAGAIAVTAAGVSAPDLYVSDDTTPLLTNIPVDPKAIVSLWGGGTFVMGEFDSSDPPMLIIHGTKDFTPGASFPESVAMAALCKRNKIPFTFYPIPGKGHGAWDGKVGGRDLSSLISSFAKELIK
jgi:acetyl esterase/lipase